MAPPTTSETKEQAEARRKLQAEKRKKAQGLGAAAATSNRRTTRSSSPKPTSSDNRKLTQAEKRAKAQREGEAQRASRKRKKEEEEEEEEPDEETKATPKKRAKKSPTSATRKSSRHQPKAKEEEEAEEAQPAEKEEDETDEKEQQEESTKPAAKPQKEPEGSKPSTVRARDKRAAASSSAKKAAPARRAATASKAKHGQKTSTTKTTTTSVAHTPPRAAASPVKKLPFGSPQPGQAQPPAPAVQAQPDPPVNVDQAQVAPPPVVPAAAQQPDPPQQQQQQAHLIPPAPARPHLVHHDDDDSFHDDDFESDDDESDVDEDLRQQALQVIAERRDRERLAEMQQQAHELARLQDQRDREAAARNAWLYPLVLFGVVLYAVWCVVQRNNPENLTVLELLGLVPRTHVQVCFRDDPTFGSAQGGQALDPSCLTETYQNLEPHERPVIQWKPCPKDAHCAQGLLQQCPDRYQIHHNWCYLSQESNDTLAEIQQLLHDWTKQSCCNWWDEPEPALYLLNEKWTAHRPLFHFSRVVGELECGYPLHLVKVGNTTTVHPSKPDQAARFVLHTDLEKQNVYLGLHPDVPVKIGWMCRLGRWIYDIVSLAMALSVLLLSAAGSAGYFLGLQYLNALLASPWQVGLASIVLLALGWNVQRKLAENRRRQLNKRHVMVVRERVYEALQDAALHSSGNTNNNSSSVNTHWLCRDLAWKLFEMSREGRHHMMTHTWPQVCRDIRSDDRVQISRRTMDGEAVEFWKWMAPVAYPPNTAGGGGGGPYYAGGRVSGGGGGGRHVRFDP